MKKYIKTAALSALERMNGGMAYLTPEIMIRIFTLIPLIFLWRAVITSGADAGMSLGQMLSYTYVSALLSDMLVIETAASGWGSEGVILKLFGRPLNVTGQLAAQTIGWQIPGLLMFSLPMAAAAPLFGISLIPHSPLFFISLPLCVSLGFSIDLMFSCLSMKLRNMNWLIGRIKLAVTSIFSGTVIPISLLPFGLDRVMKYQPFAALGGAPLSIFAGIANPAEMIIIQLAWNAVLWPAALIIFKKSKEGMVSYGG